MQGAPQNWLLQALPNSERRRVLRSCELVELTLAQLLYSPWEPLDCIYFPTTSFISLLMPTSDSATFEVGLVGHEGMVGTALVLDAETSPERATVHGAGLALRMDAAALRRELRRGGALRGGIDRYVHVRMGQLAQATVCAHFHLIEGRVARWLLMVQQRVHANSFEVTQENLALRLGVRRAGVNKAAASLQQRRLIHYRRGNITILDQRGLMIASCSCYKADRGAYDRILVQ